MKKISIPLLLIVLVGLLFYSAIPHAENINKAIILKPVDSINIDKSAEITRLKNKLSQDFIIKDFSYYIIVSNLNEEKTDDLITETIGKATNCFYNDFFYKKPTESTTIFLFKDDAAKL